jgi:hypothetical protein
MAPLYRTVPPHHVYQYLAVQHSKGIIYTTIVVVVVVVVLNLLNSHSINFKIVGVQAIRCVARCTAQRRRLRDVSTLAW